MGEPRRSRHYLGFRILIDAGVRLVGHPGTERTLSKRVVEALAETVHAKELADAPGHQVWTHRKAACVIKDTPRDPGQILRSMGRKGLESIENVTTRSAGVVLNLFSLAAQLAGHGVLASGGKWRRAAHEPIGRD